MTLIVSAANNKCLFQAADTRLTYPNGDLVDDLSVKQTQVKGNDFCFLVSYTGRALIGRTRIHDWLTIEISNYKIGNKTSEEIINYLRDKLNEAYSYKQTLIIVGIGWENNNGKVENFYFKISNEDGNKFLLTKTMIKSATFIEKEGYLPVTNDGYFKKREKKFQKVLKRDKTKDMVLIIDNLANIIRIGASHKLYGKYVGSNVTAISVKVGDSSPIAKFYSVKETTHYLPKMGVTIRDGSSEKSFFKINPTDEE